MIFYPNWNEFLNTMLMSSSLSFLLQYFNFQYYYISLSLSFLFLSICTLAFSTQMLIQYYTIPLSTPWTNFWHSYYSSAINSTILPDLFPNKWFDSRTSLSVLCTCLSYSLPSFISTNPLAAQFGIIINLLISCKIYYEPYLVFTMHVAEICMLPLICTSTFISLAVNYRLVI